MADETKYPLSIIIRVVNRATEEFRKLTKDAKKFEESFTKVGKGMTTAITAPVAALGVGSVAAFANFEKGMSNVSTLIDTATEDLGAMGREVQAIGQRVPVQLGDLTGALYDLRSSGVSAEQQFTVLENSAKLAVAGLGSTKEAADLVTSSFNAFRLEGDEAARVYDTIFKTTKFGKTTIAQLSQGFGGVAGTVASTGTKIDEYLASVAALTTTGLPAAEAHTQLKAVISGLTRETEKSRAVFKALGAKDFKDLIAKSGGLVPALQRISAKLGGSEAKILELVGSTEALNAILGLSGAQAQVYSDALSDMRNGANAVDEAFEKQNKTMHARSVRLRNSITSAGIAIGEVLEPAVKALADVVQRLAGWLNSLDDGTRKWVVGLALAAAAIGPLIIMVGKLASGIVAIKAAITVLAPMFVLLAAKVRLLAVTLFTTPIGWIILGITALIAVGYLLIKNWDKVKVFLSLMWDVVKDYIATFIGWVSSVWDSVVSGVSAAWEGLTDFFSGLWDGITGIFEKAWEKIAGIVGKVTGAVDTVIGAAERATSWLFGDDDEGGGNVLAPVNDLQRVLANRPGIVDAVNPAFAMAQGANSQAAITVEFANAPRGTRVSQETSGAAVDLSVGYQMVMP